jgi:6-phosphogluconolactonase/glucosamine-6-phosphate isomerase/deaminase
MPAVIDIPESTKKNRSAAQVNIPFVAPETKYFLSKQQFDEAVGRDFIKYANDTLAKGQKFLVGLSHGQSPAGAYRFIFDHYDEIIKPENIRYTFINSPLKRQQNLNHTFDARKFIKKLFRVGYINKEQILGTSLPLETLESYTTRFNESISVYLKEQKKEGLDYVFLASDPLGRVAGISRNSSAFHSSDIAVIVTDLEEKELTATPAFLKRSKRIAFLATKSDKRRPLAWLYSVTGKPNESPSFIRFIDNIEKRMTVFIDDQALTWPQIEIKRETPYGETTIRVDTANPYDVNGEKLPVIILIHGFLGLNSFDCLLTAIPSHKYIAAAMHYGSIPNDLPPSRYSHHIAKNIDAVVGHFGAAGHPVYIFDHSMGNIYFMMIDKEINNYENIKKYLRGRIGANPFFGEESKHAMLGFLDTLILPSLSYLNNFATKPVIYTLRRVIPVDTKAGVRKRGINLSQWLISKDSATRDKIWSAAKKRILELMSKMDSLPHLNRIPIEKALNRLPAKVFAIQTHSALEQSIAFDKQEGLVNMPKHNIPVTIIKSSRDGVAKFVPRIYNSPSINVIDITNNTEKDLFREHLYHMVNPEHTVEIIDEFVEKTELSRSK